MTTSISTSAALAVIEPAFPGAEKLGLAGFLAGYSGRTREAYALDLRRFTASYRQRQLRLFAVRRADIELFARDLEAAAPTPRSPEGSPPSRACTSRCGSASCSTASGASAPSEATITGLAADLRQRMGRPPAVFLLMLLLAACHCRAGMPLSGGHAAAVRECGACWLVR